MNNKLLELIRLTEAHIYENYPVSFSKKTVAPQTPMPQKVAPPVPKNENRIEPVKKEEPAPFPAPKRVPPPEATYEKDFKSMESLFAKRLPHIPVIKQLPDDSAAKEQATEPLLFAIIHLGESGKELTFLQNIASALSTRFGRALLLTEQDLLSQLEASTSLKLIVLSAKRAQNSSLMPLLTQSDKEILLLEDYEHYFKVPQAKSLLWRKFNNDLNSL